MHGANEPYRPVRRTRRIFPLVRVLLLLPVVIAPSIAKSQTWSEPIRPAKLPAVQIQWRVYGVDTRTHKNVFQWVFSNTADSAISFNYRIETNRRENRIGRISFGPGKSQLSGWVFSGDTLIHIDVDRRPFEVKEWRR